MKEKLLSPGVAKIDHEHGTILLNGEKLPFTAKRMGVLRKKKGDALALFLGLTRGPLIAVQPLLADGALPEPERRWSRASGWEFVGGIDRCVAWRNPADATRRRRKRDAVANLFLALLGRPKRRPVPVVEWTDHLELWPEGERAPATRWRDLVVRFAAEDAKAVRPPAKARRVA